ncbi:MAG: hypothetical protein ACLGG1_09445, partial [Gammaproteobacteria bacterium]
APKSLAAMADLAEVMVYLLFLCRWSMVSGRCAKSRFRPSLDPGFHSAPEAFMPQRALAVAG